MTTKADIYIYIVKTGKKPKKVKLKKLIKVLNKSDWGFSSRFFVNQKEADKYIKDINAR
jgi:hypothetical protein